ncbi:MULTISPECIES: hypothetical protein [unclassified Bosea (in: a-proteobacteria)]|uniref:hypothetical protein n=1 Tax=unclassified Bosea (in: a-proteobacteria) TaxID=2653178 RepID=UPI000F75D544|nr:MULTISPECIES: hypothetical protein [unclassified Bosea (in: a-proteobacteria)]AZO77689.1 hypothetical protein BLM15_08735 [Bosea sp. Tri-49]RXT18303.1 hypothetical protein B5U98_23895 [Bosea sp. Tri-39]RXT32899.1 hypothetical protein B5U99_30240 [Bosea sp. Tri-54]
MTIIDASSWPVVRWTMPPVILDDEADDLLAAFDALLARGERFVLIFDGVERPEQSSRFNRLYKDWSKRRRRDLGRLVAGAVRVEPDEAKRMALLGKLLNVAMAAFIPYPFKVVGSEVEAQRLASDWLRSGG